MKNVKPTKEQYLKNIKLMQEKNLNSDTFRDAYDTVKEYMSRDHRDIEYKLHKLFNKFEREFDRVKYNNGDFGKTYKYYTSMRDLVNELPNEIIESNCILRKIKIAINQGFSEAMKCVSEFIAQVNNYNDGFRYEIELPISSDLSSCLLDWMIMSTWVDKPEGEELRSGYVDTLPDGYIGYYQKYNDLSRHDNLMIEKILNYQMIMILASSPYNATVQLPSFLKKDNGERNIRVDFLYVPERKNSKKRELK